MTQPVKISVLTSLYNCEHFLSDYLKALSTIEGKEQIEVLLLHNAPTDNEIAILQQYLSELDFVRHIIIPERESLYRTWNRGIAMSEGKYITVWNVDDVRFPNSIHLQAEALDNNPQAALAYGDIWESGQYGICGTKRTNSPLYNYKKEFFKSYHVSCFQMWRKSIHPIIGYYDEQFKCSADFDFQIRSALHFPFVKVEEMLGIYLGTDENKLSNNGLQNLENNVIYSRYGVYEKVNFFTIRKSLMQYKKNQMLFFNEWNPLTENQPFHFLYKLFSIFSGLFKSIIKQIKHSIKQIIMKSIFKKLYKLSFAYGFDPKKLVGTLKAKRNRGFLSDLAEFKRQKGNDNSFPLGQINPILSEKTEEGGTMKGFYFHQDLYAAQRIYKANPKKHLDIGSRTDGFIAHVASFRQIELIDIRLITSQVKNIAFRQADLMNLPEDLIDYCDSISSLHALEHFGLGHYGDPIDYLGHLKGIENITKILVTGGTFYFSVPMGKQRVEFNEQRVFSLEYLIDILSPNYTIQAFAYVDDKGNLVEDPELTPESIKSNFGCWYGCGIFTLIKK
ncbi:MAG: hypothetical protein EZS26_001433 [Candidatus Ordinivivax streblomastigis]|uniref:Glycosyltransferase 2-like domain-containing protein n=1 Tax=Candidatus Ordinivivax streblomastigis TaxID=2540710 RepID=A0A5M8P1Y4_9BACT|nr:MAG: hypothetical protein EZS26_001433 [Candidatus Ordinivivax streblomastigis]